MALAIEIAISSRRQNRSHGERRVEIGDWLRDLGLERYAESFRGQDVGLDILPDLTDADLKELGVSLGDRKRLLNAASGLRDRQQASVPPLTSAKDPVLPPRPNPERRQLTVMFVDLVGSTALSSRLDPEEMREVLRQYQNAVAGEISRFEGLVANLMGDGVLAYFGWPRAHEDEAERAVRAALAIVAAVRRLHGDGDALACRVGIATGLVVVGDLVGSGATQEGAVVGDTPNLAARLQALAEPSQVVVAEATRRLLGELFILRDLGTSELKGIPGPTAAFAVESERALQSRFEAHHAGQLLPMVGRDHELALVLERWRQAAAGEGQAVLLVGEAGIGKSRLLRAALDSISASSHVAVRYQCSPHYTGTPLWPVVQQLGVAAGFEAADSEAEKLDKLERWLRLGGADVSEVAPFLADLLALDSGRRHQAVALTARQQRARTLAALADQFLELARKHPVLLVLEDAHWSDPTTLELMELTLDRIGKARVLMLLTSRLDGMPSLAGHPHMTRLTLNRLGRESTEAIVASLTDDRGLSAELRREIAARTDGVPLFVEELTKAVIEAPVMRAGGGSVPVSLHASLMARLDRVPGATQVAQAAACIGREFTFPLLAAVLPVPETELRAALESLATAQLVFARGEPPEASYAFKHALVRDAAHESLLKSRRQELHARIARALEEGPRSGVEPELLAGHLAEAGVAERAAHYWLRAAELAIERSANLEAIAHCERAEFQLRCLPPSPETARSVLAVQLARGTAARAGQGYAARQAEHAYHRACDLCEQLADPVGLVHALRGLFAVYVTRSEWRDAEQVMERMVAAASGLDDPVALALLGFVEGTTRLYTGNPAEALRCFREGLRRCEQAGADAPEELRGGDTADLMLSRPPRAQMLAHSSFALLQLGLFSEARHVIRAALARARAGNHAGTLAFTLRASCRFAEFSREEAFPEDGADELCAVAIEHHMPHWAGVGRALRGRDLLRRGAPAAAAAEIEAGLVEQQVSGSKLNLGDYLALLAEARAAMGQLEDALATIEAALEHTARSGESWYDAELHRLRADIQSRLSCEEDAAASLGRAVRIAELQGALLWKLRAARDLARLWRDSGRPGQARELLTPIYNSFNEGFDTPDLIEAKDLLATL